MTSRHEDDTNSTFCPACACRITQGQCQHGVRPRTLTSTRPCSVHDITWHAQGHQCLNCGAVADHSWNLVHSKYAHKP